MCSCSIIHLSYRGGDNSFYFSSNDSSCCSSSDQQFSGADDALSNTSYSLSTDDLNRYYRSYEQHLHHLHHGGRDYASTDDIGYNHHHQNGDGDDDAGADDGGNNSNTSSVVASWIQKHLRSSASQALLEARRISRSLSFILGENCPPLTPLKVELPLTRRDGTEATITTTSVITTRPPIISRSPQQDIMSSKASTSYRDLPPMPPLLSRTVTSPQIFGQAQCARVCVCVCAPSYIARHAVRARVCPPLISLHLLMILCLSL